jgi:hypothetical protein
MGARIPFGSGSESGSFFLHEDPAAVPVELAPLLVLFVIGFAEQAGTGSGSGSRDLDREVIAAS